MLHLCLLYCQPPRKGSLPTKCHPLFPPWTTFWQAFPSAAAQVYLLFGPHSFLLASPQEGGSSLIQWASIMGISEVQIWPLCPSMQYSLSVRIMVTPPALIWPGHFCCGVEGWAVVSRVSVDLEDSSCLQREPGFVFHTGRC